MTLIPIFCLFLAEFYLHDVHSIGCKRTCLLSLIFTIATIFLLLIFTSFFRSFRLILRSLEFLRLGVLSPSFLFLGPGILHLRTLNIKFDGCWMTASGTILIGLTGIKTGPKNNFCLGVNHFFDYLIKVIKFLATLFHFYPHQGFQAFSEVPNHCLFF